MTGRDRPPAPAAALARLGLVVAALCLLVGCAGPATRVPQAVAQAPPTPTATPTPPIPARPAAGTRPVTGAPRRASPSQPPGAPSSVRPAPPPGLVVVLDPGHNGGNADHPEIINKPVDAGLGQRKACNTVGAETVDGYPEHAFNFDVALRVERLLTGHGVTVLLTRPDDTGVGPCVDVRAEFGNSREADAVISIHADGAPPSGTGFHVIEAAGAPGGAAVAAATQHLALRVRAAMLAESGFGYATYVAGGGGLDHRSDLGGLNLATRPSIMVECGNMRNPADAARMTSPAGRQRVATALADGILAALSPG
ncbi:MAG TPA: N-acetylmuramoyl-L-alanine amidase [Mycobacteriales bacterium]|nr:N-acetylmuramoyl-L-alanine amidase [Mycobacteriales bacterium]